MSLSSSDLSELVDQWEELNLTSNLSRVEAMMCSGAVSHAVLLLCLSILYIFIFLGGVASNVLVFWGGLWPFGEVVCKVTHLVFSLNLFSSIFFLTCMSVDSYLSATLLSGALGWRRKTLRRLICASLWLLALAASVPDTYFLQAVRSPHRDGAVCRPVYPPENPRDWMVGVQLSFLVLGFAVPFPIIAVFYLLLVAAIPPSSDPERRISRRIVLSYILVFLVCWLPFHAVLLLDTLALMNVLPFTCRMESFLDVALHLTQCFSLVHCCVNPILYNLWHRSYREQLMKAFVFRYSSRTGLARLIDTSETENSAVLVDRSGPV
ncbi:atypical chemokine receptor 3-like isoform X2 [Xiphophorus maculatus]|uniref:atypical chemokine receptor 3-like isoform X2 n=1 Tax=Xiphophorus maculatus TaxID=8083 RepID=UPI000C6D2B1F|nr:atypical chemokine receptor 3-like isoform X2 [Xiphophorus maculatus]